MTLLTRLIIISLVFWGLRLEFLTTLAYSLNGWDSDSAIMGMMANQVHEQGTLPIFFWGQEYLGPLSSWLGAALQSLIEFIFPSSPLATSAFAVHPQTTVIAGSLVSFLGFVLLAEFVALTVSPLSGLVLGLLLSVGGSFLFSLTLRPLGHEAIFLCIAILLWALHFLKKAPHSVSGQIFLGLSLGFCAWIHYGAFLVLGSWIGYQALTHWPSFKTRLWPILSLQYGTQVSNSPMKYVRYFFIFLLVLLAFRSLASFFMDLSRTSFQVELGSILIKSGNGAKLIKSSVKIALILYSLFYLLFSPQMRQWTLAKFKKFKFIPLGLVLIYWPVLLGKWMGWYEASYSFTPRIASWDQFLRLDILLFEFLPKFLVPSLGLILGSIFLITTLSSFLISMQKRGNNPSIGIFALVVGLNFTIILVTGLFIERYALLGLVGILALVAYIPRSDPRWTSFMKMTMAITIAILMGIDLQPYRERLKQPTALEREIGQLRTNQCSVYFADYWDAYRIEYLSAGQVKMIPWNSQDRTPQLSQARLVENDQTCWYAEGKVSFTQPKL